MIDTVLLDETYARSMLLEKIESEVGGRDGRLRRRRHHAGGRGMVVEELSHHVEIRRVVGHVGLGAGARPPQAAPLRRTAGAASGAGARGARRPGAARSA